MRLLAALLLIAASFVTPGRARAGGPLIVNGAGQSLTWMASPVPFNPDAGMLGTLSNASAVAHLTASANVWTSVATSSVVLAAGAPLPVDVNVANYGDYLTVCGDALSPIVFDKDGSITDDIFGVGANQHIIGFAAPACGTFVPPIITEGYSVLNGKFLDGVSNASNPELTPAQFDAVLIHELGHYLGLDHSQVNVVEAFDGNASNDDAIATMFPILINGLEMASLHLDDEVAISTLYPTPQFATDFGTISGTILLSDGVTPFQGAHVIARNVADPRRTAVAEVSGAHFSYEFGGPPDPALRGRYDIRGLPPGSYTLEIESVYPTFIGGSSVGPFEVPMPVPGPPEFWNDLDEAGANPPDDPSVASPVTVVAGAVNAGIDVLINQSPPPPHDECNAATDVVTVPFSDVIDVTGAVLGAFDPLQSCVGSQQGANSVWYRFVPPVDGVVLATTVGSTYDTVLGALTGACGALSEVGCDDDGAGAATSSLAVVVQGGTPYYFEVTSVQPGGGMLHFALDFSPAAACAPVPQSGCRVPAVPGRSTFKLKRDPDPARWRLDWKWSFGAATTLADFGAPLDPTGTSYALCVYDSGGPITHALVHAGEAACGAGSRCWRSASGGFSYKDRAGLPEGITAMSLKSGVATRAKIAIKGVGAALDLPGLPLAFPVTVQFTNSDGVCWEATYGPSGIKRNDGTQVNAKGG